nr:YodL domain-containing protein [uncultured Acetatifactor sp.]
MADLRRIAREYRDEIMDGIAWVAVWKKGRSWDASAFWLDDNEMIKDDEMGSARDIVAADIRAILINEYYCAHMGNGTVEDIANGIRFHYESGYNLLRESSAYRPGIDFRLPPHRDKILDTAREFDSIDREHGWSVSDIRMGEFTLHRGHAGRKRHETYRVAYDEGTNSYNVHDSHGSEIAEEMEDCHDLGSSMQSVLRYAAKLDFGRDMGILDSQKDGRPVFSAHERSLILQFAYKMDSREKAEELADALAYCREEAPGNASLTVIDAEEINAFPDRMIGLWEMHGYGYPGERMLPLRKQRAQEFFGRGLAVHLLRQDGSEEAATDWTQVIGHDGIFGVDADEWEEERKRMPMKEDAAERNWNGELQLLFGSADRYGIYQLKGSPELDRFRFEGTASLTRGGITDESLGAVSPENYELVHMGELSDIEGETQQEKLDEIYVEFNVFRPEGFKGHSLSVSDVIVLHECGRNRAYFIDSSGFRELPGYVRRLLERFETGRGKEAQQHPGRAQAGNPGHSGEGGADIGE